MSSKPNIPVKSSGDTFSAQELNTIVDFFENKPDSGELIPGPEGPQGVQGIQGPEGPKGDDGKSSYDTAVDNGFVGTEQEWLESLSPVRYMDGDIFEGAGETPETKTTIKDGSITEEKLSEEVRWKVNINDAEFTPALDFSTSKIMETVDQSGNINFTLASAEHKIGSTIAVKIEGNGSSAVTFSTPFKVFGSFDNTKVNYLTFYCHAVDEVWVTVLNGEDVPVDGVNLLSNSEDFDMPPYIKSSGVTISDYTGLDPMGGNNAKTFTTNTTDYWTARVKYGTNIFTAIEGQQVVSLFVKPEELDEIDLFVENEAGNGFIGDCTFNIGSNASNINGGAGDSAYIENVGNGWYRLVLVLTSDTEISSELYFQVRDSTASGTDKLHVFGLQHNPGGTVDPYVKKP